MRSVPTLGNITGRSSVWISFGFTSNGSTNYEGAYLDDIVIQKGTVDVLSVISSFASPGSSPWGLTWDGVNLWNSDDVADRAYKLSTTGTVLSSFYTPSSSPGGMAWDGTNLWLADDYSDRIYKLTTSGSTLTSFTTPGSLPSGLAWDGTHLWLCDLSVNTVWKLTTTGQVVGSFSAPGTYHTGLSWNGQSLWLTDGDAGLIYELDVSGNVLNYYLPPIGFPTDIEFDGSDYWLADAYNDRIYKLRGPVIGPNPVGCFAVSPPSGAVGTVFNVDASCSRDSVTPAAQLEVRWDWENDGTYDTPWTTTKTATHQYTSGGTFTIKLEVKDTDGNTGSTTRSVLVVAPGTLPWSDNFPTTTLDGTKWPYNTGPAAVNTYGSNEPSPSYSLNLNATDEVRSQAIDLAGKSNAILSYYYEEGGGGDPAETGDDLYVDYYTSVGTWTNLRQHLGGDPTMVFYLLVEITLPAGAYHSNFAIRFRTTGDSGSDDWFVDDVLVEERVPPDITVSPNSFAVNLAVNDSTTQTLTIGNVGQGNLVFNISARPSAMSSHGFRSGKLQGDRHEVLVGSQALSSVRDNDEQAKGGPPTLPEFPVSTILALQGTTKILAWTTYTDYYEEYTNTLNAIRTYYTDFTLTETTVQSSTALQSALTGKDVLLIPEQQNATDLYSLGSSWSSVLNNFVTNGGLVVVLDHQARGSTTLLNGTGLMNINVIASYLSDMSVSVVDPSHLIVRGLPTTFTAKNGNNRHSSSNGTKIVAQTSTNDAVVSVRDIVRGHVVYIGMDFYSYNSDMARLVANAVQWGPGGLDWLTFVPTSGTVSPGGSQDITLKFLSAGLTPDSIYDANLIITSNDPDEATVTIPVSLTVAFGPNPIASFAVAPSTGYLGDTLTVDASASKDGQTPTAQLHVRWDWENDGTYDTEFTTIKTATHQYFTPGAKVIKLEVKDTDGNTGTSTRSVTVNSRAPQAFDLVSPLSGDTIRTFNPTFVWRAAVDADPGDTLRHTLYYSTSSAFYSWSTDTVEAGTDTSVTLSDSLVEKTRYYWKVRVTDRWGSTTMSRQAYNNFLVADLTPPSFTVAILQNPIMTEDIDIYAIPNEALDASGARADANGTLVAMPLLDSYNRIYAGDYQLSASGTLVVIVSGKDAIWGNEGKDTLSAPVQLIKAAEGGTIASSDARMQVFFPSGAVEREVYVMILPGEEFKNRGNGPSKENTQKSTEVAPIGKSYRIGPAQLPLMASVTLILSYLDEEVKERPEAKLEIARKEGSQWVSLGGDVNEAANYVIVQVDRLGEYRLQWNQNRTDPSLAIPTEYALFQNYPNPFNPTTTLRFALPQGFSGRVVLTVYDLSGREVKQLMDEMQEPGYYRVVWEGKDNLGQGVASGVYFYRLRAGDQFLAVKKMLLLR